LTYPLPPNGIQAPRIWSPWDGSTWTWLLIHEDDHHLMLSSHGIYEIISLMHYHGEVSNPT
jgi:hypothetical protein